MTYCTETEVYEATKLTTSAVPSVLNFIKAAEREVDRFCQTTFWAEEDAGTATAGSTTTLTDSVQGWGVDQFKGNTLWIYSGTGSGQLAKVLSNTATVITLETTLGVAPASGSKYRVIYTATDPNVSESIDGNGISHIFLDRYPVQAVGSLVVDSDTVTPSTLYLYKGTGKVQLSSDSEVAVFPQYPPQAVAISHWFGVYPFPEDVKRFVIITAALKTLAAQMGGTYNAPSMIQMPEASVTVGQAYINIEGTFRTLKREYDEMRVHIPRYPVIS